MLSVLFSLAVSFFLTKSEGCGIEELQQNDRGNSNEYKYDQDSIIVTYDEQNMIDGLSELQSAFHLQSTWVNKGNRPEDFRVRYKLSAGVCKHANHHKLLSREEATTSLSASPPITSLSTHSHLLDAILSLNQLHSLSYTHNNIQWNSFHLLVDTSRFFVPKLLLSNLSLVKTTTNSPVANPFSADIRLLLDSFYQFCNDTAPNQSSTNAFFTNSACSIPLFSLLLHYQKFFTSNHPTSPHLTPLDLSDSDHPFSKLLPSYVHQILSEIPSVPLQSNLLAYIEASAPLYSHFCNFVTDYLPHNPSLLSEELSDVLEHIFSYQWNESIYAVNEGLDLLSSVDLNSLDKSHVLSETCRRVRNYISPFFSTSSPQFIARTTEQIRKKTEKLSSMYMVKKINDFFVNFSVTNKLERGLFHALNMVRMISLVIEYGDYFKTSAINKQTVSWAYEKNYGVYRPRYYRSFVIENYGLGEKRQGSLYFNNDRSTVGARAAFTTGKVKEMLEPLINSRRMIYEKELETKGGNNLERREEGEWKEVEKKEKKEGEINHGRFVDEDTRDSTNGFSIGDTRDRSKIALRSPLHAKKPSPREKESLPLFEIQNIIRKYFANAPHLLLTSLSSDFPQLSLQQLYQQYKEQEKMHIQENKKTLSHLEPTTNSSVFHSTSKNEHKRQIPILPTGVSHRHNNKSLHDLIQKRTGTSPEPQGDYTIYSYLEKKHQHSSSNKKGQNSPVYASSGRTQFPSTSKTNGPVDSLRRGSQSPVKSILKPQNDYKKYDDTKPVVFFDEEEEKKKADPFNIPQDNFKPRNPPNTVVRKQKMLPISPVGLVGDNTIPSDGMSPESYDNSSPSSRLPTNNFPIVSYQTSRSFGPGFDDVDPMETMEQERRSPQVEKKPVKFVLPSKQNAYYFPGSLRTVTEVTVEADSGFKTPTKAGPQPHTMLPLTSRSILPRDSFNTSRRGTIMGGNDQNMSSRNQTPSLAELKSLYQ